MAGATRRFYTRYYLLTVIAPAYLTAAVFYGAAWLLIYVTHSAPVGFVLWDYLAFAAVVIVLHDLTHRMAGWGFLLTGVKRTVVDANPTAAAQMAAVLPLKPLDGRLVPELNPQVVELGAVPYVAVGGSSANHLWISTHLLEQSTTAQLRCLVAHEAGHLATGGRKSRDWLFHGAWLIALPLAALLAPWPLLFVAAALLHALGWLRFTLWQTMQAEAAADAWASAVVGRTVYAAALLENQGWIAGDRRPAALSQRLRRIGYTTAEIEAARRLDPPQM